MGTISILRGLVTIFALAATVSCGPHAAPAPPPVPLPADPPQAAPVAAARTVDSACRAPGADAPLQLPDGTALVTLCSGVYADATTTPEQRASLKKWYGDAIAELATVFGPPKEPPPTVVHCLADPCKLHFSGPTRRSRTFLKEGRIVVNGFGKLTRGTILHEMVHMAMSRRVPKGAPRVPAWFEEGLAVHLSDNVDCPPGTKRAIDDLRRLDTSRGWDGFTNMTGRITPAYCQARDEVAAWATRRGRPALLELVDAVAAGQPFDTLYGPLSTSAPPEAVARSLDARFALDENVGTNAVDQAGRSHIASLINGAIWTTGRDGSAVKVLGGSYVRADGFSELGVPDSPFSLSLWVKPLASSKVLVHTARNASGSDGWCMPLLGHDPAGHLVAQVSFQPDPGSFLVATGPTLRLNAWSHVAVTWSAGDGVQLYVDGKPAASAPPRSAAERHRDAPASPMYLFFGSHAESRCWNGSIDLGHYDGAIDEIRVYDYALTAPEVIEDMRHTGANPPHAR